MVIAIMLGMSNVILEEDRMVNDTRKYVEITEVTPDDIEPEEGDAAYSFLL